RAYAAIAAEADWVEQRRPLDEGRAGIDGAPPPYRTGLVTLLHAGVGDHVQRARWLEHDLGAQEDLPRGRDQRIGDESLAAVLGIAHVELVERRQRLFACA